MGRGIDPFVFFWEAILGSGTGDGRRAMSQGRRGSKAGFKAIRRVWSVGQRKEGTESKGWNALSIWVKNQPCVRAYIVYYVPRGEEYKNRSYGRPRQQKGEKKGLIKVMSEKDGRWWARWWDEANRVVSWNQQVLFCGRRETVKKEKARTRLKSVERKWEEWDSTKKSNKGETKRWEEWTKAKVDEGDDEGRMRGRESKKGGKGEEEEKKRREKKNDGRAKSRFILWFSAFYCG